MFRILTGPNMQARFSLLTILLSLALVNSGFGVGSEAARGKISGNLVDAENGEPLIGVNVIVEGTMIGAASDLDGNFVINKVPPGTYDILVSMIGYAKTRLADVQVAPGENTKISLALKPEILETEDVVVTAKLITNTEASLLKQRQKAEAVSDAISAEAISRSGSGDAAEAMKQVTGASVVDGKYVYIRGLGERYSSTQLNGAELPTADPDKKAVQMDLFPSGLLDNIVTVKTFTPDRPGNFSGGVVDIGTKAFPERFIMSFSASTSYNTQASFNDDFLTYRGGSKDWLATDDGTRDIPDVLQVEDAVIPNPTLARLEARRGDPTKALVLDSQSKAFNAVMAPVNDTPPVNQSYSFLVGNQRSLLGRPLGYVASVTYSRSASFYDEGFTGRYSLGDVNAAGLNPELLLSDAQGSDNVTIGGLLNVGYKPAANHELNFNTMYSRGGESSARSQFGTWPKEYTLNDTSNFFENRVLSYTERELHSFQFRGDHYLPGLLRSKLNWLVSISDSRQDEPDLRFFANMRTIRRGDTTYSARHSGFADPSRYYRNLNEDNKTLNVDLATPFKQWSGRQSKFKIGASYSRTDRLFRERIFSISPALNYDGDPDAFFAQSNMGIVSIDTLDAEANRYSITYGNVVADRSKTRNNYDGDLTITAFYGMLDLPITSRLRFIGGTRFEETDLNVVSLDSTQVPGNLQKRDWLPSLNFIYSMSEKTNLRAAFTKTLARPTFREIAPFESFEFINGNFFIGNPELKRTLITNLDLRWEWFMRPGEILAVSAFYKFLQDPIERTIIGGTNGQIQYKNLDDGKVYGVEVELRRSLDWLGGVFDNLSAGVNVTFAQSEIAIAQDEFAVRKAVDPSADPKRSLQGQSPYIVNLDLLYSNRDSRTSISVNFNRFGSRLSNVSLGGTPDVFERPRSQLNFTASQGLFNHLTMKIGVKNILNSSYIESYEFKGNEFIYQEYKLGRTISFGLSYGI